MNCKVRILFSKMQEHMPNFKHLSRPAQFIYIMAPLHKNANENQIHLLQRIFPESVVWNQLGSELNYMHFMAMWNPRKVLPYTSVPGKVI